MKRLLSTPATLALVLYHGILIAFAAKHFLGLEWNRLATITFYSMILIWGFTLAWWHRGRLMPMCIPDVLFAGFLTLVVASLLMRGSYDSIAERYSSCLLPMVVVPYLCGRIMRISDIDIFARMTVIVGIGVLPLLFLDRLASPDQGGGRWAFFGQSHTALLVGALLAITLTALAIRGAEPLMSGNNFRRTLSYYGAIGLVAGVLVWVSARGYLLGAIVSLAVLASLDCRRRGLQSSHLRYLIFVIAVSLSTSALLSSTPNQSYAAILSKPPITAAKIDSVRQWDQAKASVVVGVSSPPKDTSPATIPRPILGETSCYIIKEGLDSVAIRWILYGEAIAMIEQAPLLGVGAARFGNQSCLGSGGFPHSTTLQAFAELGVIGGGLLMLVITIATVTLTRECLLTTSGAHAQALKFALGILVITLLADQLYGNYFMSIEVSLILGLVASMHSQKLIRQKT